ncbi:hypothetical protein P800_01140 [Acinetobacter lwoffii NCTC 5866 = CIP 64.10 = NIPH 512]|uniref:Uncharacterized protein n=1 Tax=Acinetobacter lwoffii NCTC 5866 = CIP 64.10 = NIPH 512 TaxID=981327 RepID=A0ABN0Q0C5_ACILW|nr:hypothetical protein P800_01140 [Acinetobacter lwoffii NCTC 5866 = CIP 64.10 = NIPH 512]
MCGGFWCRGSFCCGGVFDIPLLLFWFSLCVVFWGAGPVCCVFFVWGCLLLECRGGVRVCSACCGISRVVYRGKRAFLCEPHVSRVCECVFLFWCFCVWGGSLSGYKVFCGYQGVIAPEFLSRGVFLASLCGLLFLWVWRVSRVCVFSLFRGVRAVFLACCESFVSLSRVGFGFLRVCSSCARGRVWAPLLCRFCRACGLGVSLFWGGIRCERLCGGRLSRYDFSASFCVF